MTVLRPCSHESPQNLNISGSGAVCVRGNVGPISSDNRRQTIYGVIILDEQTYYITTGNIIYQTSNQTTVVFR